MFDYPSFADDDPSPFTPEKFPNFSPEACALLNMPVEECPPEVLCILLAALAEHIAENLPPELGLSDPRAIFSILWDHMAVPLDQAEPDTAPKQPLDEAPSAPAEAMPDAPPASPDHPPEADALAEADDAAHRVGAALAAVADGIGPPDAGRRRARHRRRLRLSRCFIIFSNPVRGNRQRGPPSPPRLYYACAGPP